MRPSDRFRINPPRNLLEYLEWHREVLKEDIGNIAIENEYAKVIEKIHAMFGGTLFWKDFTGRQKSIGQAYRLETNFQLFGEQQYNLFTKEFCSVKSKLFRKNIIQNKNYPNPPQEGWLVIPNIFDRIHDLIRTTITVKYLDGIKFMEKTFQQICQEKGYLFRCDYENRDMGYYALHCIVTQDVGLRSEIFKIDSVTLEIQVTTQIHSLIKELLHKFYAMNRESYRQTDWHWDYTSDEFALNNIGHTLHLVQGLIAKIREGNCDVFTNK